MPTLEQLFDRNELRHCSNHPSKANRSHQKPFFLSRVHDGPLFCALAVALLGRRLLESRRVITVSSETVSYQPAVGRNMKVRFRDVESAEVKLLPSSYFLQPVFRAVVPVYDARWN